MNPLQLIALELRHRPASALLTLLVLSLSVASVQFFVLAARASEDQTRMIQRDAGLNLLILPAGTDVGEYWAQGYAEGSMDQGVMAQLKNQQVANRLVPLLQRRVDVGGVNAMLTGIAPEVFKGGKKMKAVFGMSPDPGTVYLGAGVVDAEAASHPNQVEIQGRTLTVAQVLPPTGTADDMRVYCALSEAQELLKLPGRINQIQALECHCADPTEDPVAALNAELQPLLPGALIVRRADLADARRHQRQLAESLLAIATPIMMLLSGFVVAALAAMNLRQRRPELAVFRALGFGSGRVAAILLGRILFLAVIGAALGTALSWLLLEQAPDLFRFTAKPMTWNSSLLTQSLWMTPAFAFIAASIPLSLGLTRDPVRDLQAE
jgi:putative ABC transport system permease protein